MWNSSAMMRYVSLMSLFGVPSNPLSSAQSDPLFGASKRTPQPWETSRLQRPAWRQVGDKVGNKARQGSQSSRWATLWQTRFGVSWWVTSGKHMGKHGGRHSATHSGRQSGTHRETRFQGSGNLEPCAYMPKEGGTRYHTLLLEIQTQQLPAVGNFFVVIFGRKTHWYVGDIWRPYKNVQKRCFREVRRRIDNLRSESSAPKLLAASNNFRRAFFRTLFWFTSDLGSEIPLKASCFERCRKFCFGSMRCVKQIPHLEPNMLNTPKHQDPLVVFAGSELFLFHCLMFSTLNFCAVFTFTFLRWRRKKLLEQCIGLLAVSHNAAQRSKRNQKL